MLTRFPNWPECLNRYLDVTRNAPFCWGINDCALRACDAVLAMTGTDIAFPFRNGYTTEISAAKAMLRFAGGGLEEVAEKVATQHLMPEISVSMVGRGDIVLMDTDLGPALGIVTMNAAVAEFASPRGVERWPVRLCRRAWRVG